jgi:competence protein ComEC
VASPGILAALSILVGAACGTRAVWLRESALWLLPCATITAIVCYRGQRRLLTASALIVGFMCAGIALAADARDRALRTPLREHLHSEFGDFAIDAFGPAGRHDPVPTRAVIEEDATQSDNLTTLRVRVVAVRLRGTWFPSAGGVTLAIGGRVSTDQAAAWRAGRMIQAPVTFRRPARYLNEGVPDFEQIVALDGTTLFGSVRSGLLIELLRRGSARSEIAAQVRLHIRTVVHERVRPYDAVSGGIVSAVLIGDRSGLPDAVRELLQEAGTYHVIAISGGNIAILAGMSVCALMLVGVTGRAAASLTVILLIAYAGVVTAGASVWRATLMAGLYLGARVLDHRSPPWHVLAVAAAVIVCARPLEQRDPGFILTFGATAALLESARRIYAAQWRLRPVAWLATSVTASLAVEVLLLPVFATVFGRITAAGLLLNLLAVPLMGIVQIAGIAVVCFDRIQPVALMAGWLAHAAATAIVESARLVEWAPWLVLRVSAPSALAVVLYYVGLTAALTGSQILRRCGGAVWLMALLAVCTNAAFDTDMRARSQPGPLMRVTMFDVGQGDATLVELPGGHKLMVDTGGSPFGNGGFDVGGRVLAPALWARGLRTLDTLLLTHGDPDHIGGAARVIRDFHPNEVWEGVPAPPHHPLHVILEQAQVAGSRVDRRQAGDDRVVGGARLRVLHPPPPDWERRRVRNDDSVVVELLYGDVGLLLAGDISAEVERSVVSRLTPARVRILKVAHHGSRTSTSQELVDVWKPQFALIGCGRGNSFGHPAPEVLHRVQQAGAAVYRTDLHGQITLETDGRSVRVETYAGGKR